jgi:hypothetical protein
MNDDLVAFYAHHARAQLEDLVSALGWVWNRRLSLLVDTYLVLEEGG